MSQAQTKINKCSWTGSWTLALDTKQVKPI